MRLNLSRSSTTAAACSTNEGGVFEQAAHERLVERPKLIPLARVHLTYL